MKTTICAALAAAAFALTPMTASAISVTASIFDSAPQLTGLTGLELFGANSFGGTWSSGDPTVTPPPGSVNGAFLSPFTPDGALVGSSPYFSVGGSNATNGSGSPNTLSGFGDFSSIRLLWGSIDVYNSITFGSGMNSFTITGTDIGDLGGFSVANGAAETVAIIDFMVADGGTFDSITFLSEGPNGVDIPAMEFATVIPVPAGVLLIGSAFALAGAARRFGRKADA